MSAHKKKPVSEDMHADDDYSDDADDSSSDDAAEINEEVQVDFEGRNPIAEDFDGIKQLLRQLFLKAHVNLTEMSNLIISQSHIGSVIKQSWDEEMDDEDDQDDENVVFGVTTAVNLTEHKDNECVQQLKTMILERAEKSSTDATLKLLRDALTNDARMTGLLVNERYINIPAQISVPMLENLCKEIKRAADKNMPYNFSYFVMVLKFHRKEAKGGKPMDDIYSNPEEELFLRESLAHFEYSVLSEMDTGLTGKWKENDEALTPYRKVVVLDGKRLPDIVEQLNGFIHGS